MALRVLPMEALKLELLLEPERTGDSVAEVCRRRGISRASFYRYRRRYAEEGPAGLVSRSHRPGVSPGRIDPGLELAIVTMRKRHPRWGARRIHAELRLAGLEPPAVATIHRALRRNHLVAPQPARKPKARKRFERPVANDLWQIDATQVQLAEGERVWVVDVLDDHARFLLAAHACTAPTGEAAWACFVAASAAYGLPRQLLTDNHLSFTGRFYGITVEFERRLCGIGVQLINAAPAHPQTLGKLERFHRTLKDWLGDEGPPGDLEELQRLLERFRLYYNERRPHQGIGNRTPSERYWRGELGPGGEPVYPPHSLIRTVKATGSLTYRYLQINIGIRFAGAKVRIVEDGGLIHIYYGPELVRSLAPDGTRSYQPRLTDRRREVPIYKNKNKDLSQNS